ncbi:MAG: DUF3237 domain-containing protein [Gammaproteobacteria bacterium]|nr:DUF3237 domain-containing protein [Gammaproteobacteria bacterium]
MDIHDDYDILKKTPLQAPYARLVWTAIIDIAPRESLGSIAAGERFIVPILGGRFYAGSDMDGLNGVILPGGADRQLLRQDGVKELNALYEMKIEDGPIITISNRVIVDESRDGARYAMSVINATVEAGRFDWINKRVLIGTLESLKPARMSVVVRAWLMDSIR